METTNPKYCPACGKPLPTDASLGSLCPQCLIKSGFASGTEAPGDSFNSDPRIIAPTVTELQPHFSQLEIQQLIGHGGMGAVYRARQVKLNRMVALKILARNAPADARFAERFQREAQALAQLNHPNIVTVYDYGEAGGFYFLLMEFVDGVNLRQLEDGKHLSPEQALTIVPHLCDALQYAHSQGIIHRDIKPENILLDKAGRVKIADFGIARILGTETSPNEPLTGEHHRVGTPHYMAPEQVEKPSEVDHRADIYSLGVVFYEMLTGELPLGRFAPPSHKVQVDVRLDDIVLKALEKEPELRYQQVSEVKTRVEAMTGDEPSAVIRSAVSAGSDGSVKMVYPPIESRPGDVANIIYGLIPIVLMMIATPFFTKNEIALAGIYLGLGTALLIMSVRLLHIRYENKVRKEGGKIENDFTGLPADSPPKLCAPALIGTVLTVFSLLLLFLLFFGFQKELKAPTDIKGVPSTLMLLLTQMPVAATVLGFVGVARIRASRGHRYGMKLALFSALTFPAIITALIVWLFLSKIVETYLRGIVPDYTNEAMMMLTAVITLECTLYICRKLRGKQDTAPAGSADNIWNGITCALYAFLATMGAISAINNLSEYYGMHSPARLVALLFWSGVAGVSIKSLINRLRHHPFNRITIAVIIIVAASLAGNLWFIRTHQQDAVISGKVVDEETGRPIVLASVTLDSNESNEQPLGAATTNNAGNFLLRYPQKYHFFKQQKSGEELPDARLHFFSAGYEIESLTWEEYYTRQNKPIALRWKNQKAAQVLSTDHAVTLEQAFLHTPGTHWTIAVNVTNHTQKTRFLGIRTTVEKTKDDDPRWSRGEILSKLAGTDTSEYTWHPLLPSSNTNVTLPIESALLAKRPLRLNVTLLESSQSKPTSDFTKLFETDLPVVVHQDVSQILNLSKQETISPIASDSERAASSASITEKELYTWQSADPNAAPDWAAYFPDNKTAADELAGWADVYNRSGKDDRPTSEILTSVRNGLRNLRVDRRMPVLRFIGNKYIWNQSAQDPAAIELMYQAADPKADPNFASFTRGAAIYFGLSVVKEKTPAILKELADIAIQSDDPNDLDRIAWGTRSQQTEMLEMIKPYANDERTSGKAEILRQILSGELKAFAWATEQAKLKASDNYTTQLPQIKAVLTSGTSEERFNVLDTILQNRIALIMDESFIPAFAAAAKDERVTVRKNITIITGNRWIWSADRQSSAAIELMMKLSHDPEWEVRYNAVYYGLSVVRGKSDAVIDRLVQMILEDGEKNLVQRILWGLKDYRPQLKEKLRDKAANSFNPAEREAAQKLLDQATNEKAN